MLFPHITAVECLNPRALEGFKIPAQGHVKVIRGCFPIWLPMCRNYCKRGNTQRIN